MRVSPNQLVPYCKMCDSGIVTQRSIRLNSAGEQPVEMSYWFDCQSCGYSSPGRASRDQADDDVAWKPLGRPA